MCSQYTIILQQQKLHLLSSCIFCHLLKCSSENMDLLYFQKKLSWSNISLDKILIVCEPILTCWRHTETQFFSLKLLIK